MEGPYEMNCLIIFHRTIFQSFTLVHKLIIKNEKKAQNLPPRNFYISSSFMLKVVRFPNSHPIAIKVENLTICQRRCLFGRDSDGEAERSLGAPCGRLAGATRCVRTIRGVPTRDLSG